MFSDLSPITLAKQHNLCPVTAHLQLHQVTYRWGFPFRLSASKVETQYSIRDLHECKAFTRNLGLPPYRRKISNFHLPIWFLNPFRLLQRFGPQFFSDTRRPFLLRNAPTCPDSPSEVPMLSWSDYPFCSNQIPRTSAGVSRYLWGVRYISFVMEALVSFHWYFLLTLRFRFDLFLPSYDACLWQSTSCRSGTRSVNLADHHVPLYVHGLLPKSPEGFFPFRLSNHLFFSIFVYFFFLFFFFIRFFFDLLFFGFF